MSSLGDGRGVTVDPTTQFWNMDIGCLSGTLDKESVEDSSHRVGATEKI